MVIDLSVVGLVIIALAWLIQLVYALKGKREMKKSFVIIYAIGVLLVVIKGYMGSDSTGATINLLSLVLAVLVLLTAIWKKPSVETIKKKKR